MNLKAISWTPLEALFRSLTILFVATFVGAFVMPMAADGAVPATWADWKKPLAVALAAAMAAEFLWIRTHLSALAAAMGLTNPVPSPATNAVAAAKNDARGYGRMRLLVKLAVAGIAFFVGVSFAGAFRTSVPRTAAIAPLEQVEQLDVEQRDEVANVAELGARQVEQTSGELPMPASYEIPLAGQGCGWWSSSGGTVVQKSAADIAACVLAQVLGTGPIAPASIVAACAPATLADVTSILASLIDYYTQPTPTPAPASPDGGPAVAAVAPGLCGLGTAPVAGAPLCMTLGQLARLHAAHGAAAHAAASSK